MRAEVAATGRRGLLLPALLALLALAVLLGLGTWQLERKRWKEDLGAMLSARLSAAPATLPQPSAWATLDQKEWEFRRVTFMAEFQHAQEARVYGSGSTFRPDVSGPGYWIFTPARLSAGTSVMVNRGFVPEGQQDPQSRQQGQTGGVIEITGVMRWPERRGMFTPGDDLARNLWFVRDHHTIAAVKNLGAMAPFYIEQESPPAPGGWPKAGRLRVNLPNNHLGYALTWYGLALSLTAVFIFWMRARRRG